MAQSGGTAGAVLRALLEHGPVARSAVARLTGLSPALVTGHTAELARRGLLREADVEVTSRGRGRPHLPVELDDSQHIVAGLHIAVEHATVALLDVRGGVLAEGRIPHEGRDPGGVLHRSAQTLQDLVAVHGHGRTVLGLGVATGGWVDPVAGCVIEHPMLGWRDVPVAATLEHLLRMPVHVDSHSRAMIRAEQLFGNPRSRESVVALFVGNVVDAAFATGDQVHHGFRSQAGGVAHLPVPRSREPCPCGRTGCLEVTVSERGLVARAADAGIIDTPSIWDLIDAAEAGNDAARDLFRERALLVGQAAALLTDVFNPEVVIVVEPGVARFPECLQALRASVAAHLRCGRDAEETVMPTSFPHMMLALAAGVMVLDVLYRDPFAVAQPRLRLVREAI